MRRSSVWSLNSGVALVAAALVAIMASTAVAQTAEEIIDKNVKAQGGKDALMKLKSLARKGKVSVDGTFGQMEGTVEEVCIPWKKARRSLDLVVFVQDEGYDGKIAWRDGMMGLQELEGEEADQIKQAVELNPFVNMAKNEMTAAKLDDEKIDEVDYYVIELSPKDRPKVKIYIDKKTDQIARAKLKQNNPQFGEIEITADSSGYEAFGPIKLATKEKVTIGEVLQIETTYTDTKVDGDVDETIFDKPKEDAPKDEKKDDKKEEKKDEKKDENK